MIVSIRNPSSILNMSPLSLRLAAAHVSAQNLLNPQLTLCRPRAYCTYLTIPTLNLPYSQALLEIDGTSDYDGPNEPPQRSLGALVRSTTDPNTPT